MTDGSPVLGDVAGDDPRHQHLGETAELLVHGADLVVTMDAERRELVGGWVAIDGGVVVGVGAAGKAMPPARHRIDATGCLVTPGLVNGHHHMWQNLTRAYAPMTSTGFLGWLGALMPLWAELDEEDIFLSTWIAMAELALGGCTTTVDHLYLQPAGRPSFAEAQLAAAAEVGLRFSISRGSVNFTAQDGGTMPDRLRQDIDEILADSERLVKGFHDPSPHSMVRFALAPHSLFAATSPLMIETAALAEKLDVRLHTHLAADHSDEELSRSVYGCSPVEWFESVGWCSDRTWVAHCIFPTAAEIARLGAAGVGAVHCATACLLMGVGITPVPDLQAAGCPVGIGVDGSSNSDASSMWLEARTALLAQRFRAGPEMIGARSILELATVGGAAAIGRAGEVGELVVGAAGDLAVWPLRGVAFAGAVSDPVEAWLRCGPSAPTHTVVAGVVVVEDGRFVPAGLTDRLARHDTAARRLQRV